MKLEKIFKTRKLGINLDELLTLICGVCMGEFVAHQVVQPDSLWMDFAVYTLSWIAGAALYRIIRLFVVKVYYKICPPTTKGEEFEEIFKDNNI